MSGQIATVNFGGRTYKIPGIWIAGLMQIERARGERCSYEDAVLAWIRQAELAELESEDE